MKALATFEDKLRFAQKHIRSPKGERFDVSSPERAWQVDDLFKPVDGYRVCPRDKSKLCDACGSKIGKILPQWDWSVYDAFELHREASPECAGLMLKPITVTIISRTRREGKSFGVYSLTFTNMCLLKRRHACVIAKSDAQIRRIVTENIGPMLEQSPYLKQRVTFAKTAGLYTVPSTGSSLRMWSASAASARGSSYAYTLLDEAAYCDPEPFIGLSYSIGDAARMECPRGCEGVATIPISQFHDAHCSMCGARCIPFHPRVILYSSNKALSGDEIKDWWPELLASLGELPHEQVYMSHSDVSQNPSVDRDTVNALTDMWSRVDALKALAEAEASNTAVSSGDKFLDRPMLAACSDLHWQNQGADPRPCVAFLDTSISNDLTSLFICADNVEMPHEICPVPFVSYSTYPWESWRITHARIWDPKDALNQTIQWRDIESHLRTIVENGFPNLKLLMIDTRHAGDGWGKDLGLRLQALPWWRNRAKIMFKHTNEFGEKLGQDLPEFTWGQFDRRTGWNLLLDQIANRRIWLPGGLRHTPGGFIAERIERERRGIKRERTGAWKDVNREAMHADLLENLASLALLANRERAIELAKGTRSSFFQSASFARIAQNLSQAYRSPSADLRNRT